MWTVCAARQGSPYGPTIQTLILPYEMEVVTGPYALTWGQNALGAVRVRTPFQHVVAAEAGYGGSPRRYGAAAVVGSHQAWFGV